MASFDPLQIWIARRPDGQSGTGSADDPYDGSSVQQDIQTVTLGIVLNDPSGKTAFGVAYGHGYSDGMLIAIRGAADPNFNGDFIIFDTDNDTFRYVMPQAPTQGPGLSTTCARLIYRFDSVMSQAPAHALIRIGPGVFETQGYAQGASGTPAIPNATWQPKTGQKIIGSGMGVTTLKLVHAAKDNPDVASHAIGTDYNVLLEHFEVSDLTIDCNLAGQTVPPGSDFAPACCGGIAVGGRHIRLRRVRVVNFGTQAIPECFALFTAAAYDNQAAKSFEAVGNVIEDCVVERPSENNTHETTLLGNVGDAYTQGRGNVVRRCFVDCSYAGGSVSSEMVAVASLTAPTLVNGEYEFTLTTKRPHHRTVGNNVVLNHVAPGGPPPHPFNASFTVKEWLSPTQLKCKFPNPPTPFPEFNANGAFIGVYFHGPASLSGTGCVTEGNAVYDCSDAFYTDTGSTRDAVVRYNYCSNVRTALYFAFNPGVSEAQEADSLTYSVIEGKFIATFTIADGTPLLRLRVADVVDVARARVGGLPAPDGSYNGTKTVVSVSADRKQFSYEMQTDPGGPAEEGPDGAIYFQSRWYVRRLIYQKNIADLYAFDSNTALAPVGNVTIAYTPLFMFPQAVFRENVFRYLDDAPAVAGANGQRSYAFGLYSFSDTLIENNLVGLIDPHLIYHGLSHNVRAFNNVASSGEALPIFHDLSGGGTSFEPEESLEDRVTDALLFSLL